MPSHAGQCNFQFADGSVRALGPEGDVALAELGQGFRRAGGGTRAFWLGRPCPMLERTLAALRRQRVALGPPRAQAAAGHLPALLVTARRDGLAPPGAGVLFLAATPGTPVALLLPAVQCAREAARRLMPERPFELLLVQRQPGIGPVLPIEQMALSFKHIRD